MGAQLSTGGDYRLTQNYKSALPTQRPAHDSFLGGIDRFIKATHRVEPARDGVRLTLTLQYKGILGSLMAIQLKDLNWDYLTKEAQGLKARCEQ